MRLMTTSGFTESTHDFKGMSRFHFRLLSSMRAVEPRTFDKTVAEDENGIQYEFYPPEDYNNELCAIM